MWLVRFAMDRPITVMVSVVAVVLFSVLAIMRMKVDIFPSINMPRVTVVQPYGGMDPAQMEGYLVTFYEQHFFYISDVDHVSSRSIQGAALMDVYFRPDANMSDAMAQVVAQVERTRAYLPPGTVTPFILRYDVGNVPVGFLVFSSDKRNLGQIQDLVYSRIRPVVSTTPGVSTPPPFGGNQRSIVISVDSNRLNQYRLSIDDIVQVIQNGNMIMPSGVVRIGDLQRMSSVNSVVDNIQDLGWLPIQRKAGPAVYLRDIATVEDSTDIQTGYALVDGKRTVYMAISKQASASTLTVVDGIKKNIPYMQSLLPPDIKVAFVFDQSVYVTEALNGLLMEGGLGALLTGGVVLLFLRDLRSSLIVVLSIPFALLAALVGIWVSGQTINIMTLSGLSLAVGILVDEATVSIENIHSHLQKGKRLLRAIYDGSVEVVIPNLLALLAVISVFTPSFFMVGATQSLFVPLSLAVGYAMLASYFLSATFVPVLSGWLLKAHADGHGHGAGLAARGEAGDGNGAGTGTGNGAGRGNGAAPNGAPPALDFMDRIKVRYRRTLGVLLGWRLIIFAAYGLCIMSAVVIYPMLGSEIFPAGNPKGFQLRLKGPIGTRFERTEDVAKQVLNLISSDVGPDNVDVSVSYAGTQPPSYGNSSIYIWTSGPQEAVLDVQFKEEAKVQIRALQEQLRGQIARDFPKLEISFEAGDIVNKVMNFGSATPIQVDVDGPNYDNDKEYARRLLSKLKTCSYLRDVGIVQPLDYPSIDVQISRIRAGQEGISVADIGKALVAATYSSRFVTPIFWRDAKNGLAYQVQVQVPQQEINSLDAIGRVPVHTGAIASPLVRDVASVTYGTMPGELDHYNMRRVVSISANIGGDDLGRATTDVQRAIDSLGDPPRGVRVNIRGQVPTMKDTFAALSIGVGIAIVAILLMLVSFFQSVRVALIIVSVIPAILSGAICALAITHSTVNVQSFMGAIMATGVGVANAILVVVFAEDRRRSGMSARTAAITGAAARLRPVLMTSIAMIAGMIPMALGMSEGGDRTAPLGRAVIGGLLLSTTAVLFVMPLIYASVQNRAQRKGVSMLPETEEVEEVRIFQGSTSEVYSHVE
jgi:multidrug efflux pump subunit AcrB